MDRTRDRGVWKRVRAMAFSRVPVIASVRLLNDGSKDTMLRTIAVLVALLSLAGVAHAQAPATSFEELASRLKAGETVSVTIESGEVIRGEVERVSDTILALKRPGRDLAAQDVLRVDHSRTFKQRGALIGFGAGFSIGALGAASDDCRGSFGPCFSGPGGVLVLGGIVGLWGAGVGTLVGAFIHTDRVIFLRARSGSARTGVVPLLWRSRAGLRMQVEW